MNTDIPSKFSVTELAIVLGATRDYVIRRCRRLNVPSFTLGEGRNAKRYFRTVDLEACQEIWAEMKWRAKSLGVHNFGDE